jgi:5-methyltetrahydrofolate--homocysteine methyltransferase
VSKPQISSLYSAEDVRQDLTYLIVAERTNTNGSRQFKRLLQEENWDGLVSMARTRCGTGRTCWTCAWTSSAGRRADMHEVVKRT